MRIGKRRIEWKPWNWSTRTWIVALILLIALSPLLTRWCCLWQIPDIPSPFDEKEFIGEEIPDELNAFRHYEAAAEILRNVEPTWLDVVLLKALSPKDAEWDDRLSKWLVDNRSLLVQFEQGSSLDRSLATSWHRSRAYMPLPLHMELPKVMNIAQAEAIRCQSLGDIEKAWEWHRACLRCGRHYEMNLFPVALGIGRKFQRQAYDGIARWSAHPQVTVQMLQAARDEVAADRIFRVKDSDMMKAEYLLWRNEFKIKPTGEILFPNWQAPPQYELPFSYWKRWTIWTFGEPELSLRLMRQVLANQLQVADIETGERPDPIGSEYPAIFELGPKVPHLRNRLTADQLQNVLKTSFGQRAIKEELFSDFGMQRVNRFNFKVFHTMCRVSVSLIDVTLATQLYHRQHDRFPETLEDLVPAFLDSVPIDEFSKEGSPLRYLRDSDDEARVWTVFVDGVDDGGDDVISDPAKGTKDRVHRIKFERSGKAESSE